MEQSSNLIAEQTGFEQRRVLKSINQDSIGDDKKQPVFGILCSNETVWAEVVDDVEAGILQPLIS